MSAGSSPYGWRIGSLRGTPIYIGRTWPIIVIVIVVLFGPILSTPARPASYGYWVAAGYAILLFVSVLVHEAAHALVARARGRSVDRIAIDVWGGHTVYDTRGSSALTEALVAVAGPLANLVLALLGWLLQPYVTAETPSLLLEITTRANLLVAAFNLLPGLPLDGGHIVQSVVWGVTGSRTRGMVVAGWFGRVVAVLALAWFIGAPLLQGRTPSLLVLLWVGMICLFLWRGASSAVTGGRVLEATAAPITEVTDPVQPVRITDRAQTARELLAATPGTTLVVIDDSFRPVGLVDPQALALIPEAAVGGTPVSAVTIGQPDGWAFSVGPDSTLTDIVQVMGERQLSYAIPVDSVTGQVIGLVRADRVNAFIGRRLGERG